MAQYFSKFPLINYNGINAINITLRAKINENFKMNAVNFYPYTIKDGETASDLAYDYYGDPNYSWLIYFANDIIDPYYDWPLSSYDFEQYIIKKYGSIQEAMSTTLYYKKLPTYYYVNNDTNLFKTTDEYDALVDGYNWTLETNDEEVLIASLSNPDPSIWAAVDAYTDETEQNENKRYIKLLDRRLASDVDRQLRDILNGR